MDKEWIEVNIITSSEAVEAVSGLMYNTPVKGISIEDSADVEFKRKHPGDWDYFDEELLKIKEGAVIKGYYKDDEHFLEYIKYIKEGIEKLPEYGIDKGEGLVTYRTVNEEDWENNWKQYYKPTRIGKHIVIKPIWEEYEPLAEDLIIEMDPGMAFGTGTHETTRMCISSLEERVKPGMRIFDIGTGSGILALTAAKLGATEVFGVDLDPVAVDSARSNVSYNKVDNVKILYGNLTEVVEGEADIVVANIIADVIIGMASSVIDLVKNKGYFICSGIIHAKRDEVETALKTAGFYIDQVKTEGEWVCVIGRK